MSDVSDDSSEEFRELEPGYESDVESSEDEFPTNESDEPEVDQAMEEDVQTRRWQAAWISFVYVLVLSSLQGRGFDVWAVLFFLVLLGLMQYEITCSRSFRMETDGSKEMDSDFEVD